MPWALVLLFLALLQSNPGFAGDLSLVPILGYNPTYGFFGGGGSFYEKSKVEDRQTKELAFGFHGLMTEDAVVKAELRHSQWLGDRWEIKFEGEVARGFEPNYGLGNRTRVDDRVDVWQSKLVTSVELLRYSSPEFSIGPALDLRARRNRPLKPELAAREKDPYVVREDTFGFGFEQHWDHRNIKDDPSYGWYQNFSAKVFPELTQSGKARTFALFEGDIRFFQNLMADDLVLAYQLAGGLSAGRPSYLSQYRLGGTDRLRGFYENRFRGRMYYLQQSELRFPIFKMIGGATFLEFGEATAGGFETPSMSYGVGLRVGLPPDYVAKLRVDFAFSKDQNGVFLDFGHAF